MRQISSGLLVAITCCSLLASWAGAEEQEEDSHYKSSVFGLLFGNLLDGEEGGGSHGGAPAGKDIPYDYVEHFGSEGGEIYSKASMLVIDRYTSKKTQVILAQDKNKSLDSIGIKLLKCWQKPTDGVGNDARALLFLSKDSSMAGKNAEGTKAWVFSKYSALSYSDSRYELILEGCLGSGSAGADETHKEIP